SFVLFFFFQAEDGIRDRNVTGVQTCALPIFTTNGDAPVVVMTTEVLRNMLYASSVTLRGLGYVVLDEVHYLADRFRGAVWEEVRSEERRVGEEGRGGGER